MKFQWNYLSIHRKVKRFLEEDELHSAIDLLHTTLQKSKIEPIEKAKINGIVQSFHVNELAATRKLLVPEDNRKMLKKNMHGLLKKIRWQFIMWRYGLWIKIGSIILLLGSFYFLKKMENQKTGIQPFVGEITFPIKIKKKTPRHVWEAEIREEERAAKKRELENLISNDPIYAVNLYDHQKSRIINLTPKSGVDENIEKFKYAVCIASFDEEKNALKFSSKVKNTEVRFFEKNKKYRVLSKFYLSENEANRKLNLWKKRISNSWVVKF